MNRYLKTLSLLVLSAIVGCNAAYAQTVTATPFGPQAGDTVRFVPQAAPDRTNWDTRVFPVRYVDLTQLNAVLSVFGGDIRPVAELGVISVRAPKEVMPGIESVIKQLDIPTPPKKSVELTTYLLRATDQTTTAALPTALQPVINQLKNVFAYKGFELLDVQVVRTQDGGHVAASGNVPALINDDIPLGNRPIPWYDFQSEFLRIRSAEKDDVISLTRMRFSVTVPTFYQGGWHNQIVSINTDLDVPVGQQVVVGKTTVGKSALILVINARL